MLFDQKKINTLILISFIFSSFLSIYYLSKYDKYSEYNKDNHPMIKIAVQNHWHEAQIILDDIRDGKKFWEAGKKSTDSFLPQKILALFYYAIDEELEENGKTKVQNGKAYYLIFKSLLYYFLLYLLSKKLFLTFPKQNVFFTILFLALIPDLFQYHSSFWNESIFFSIQLLLIYFFLDNSQKFLNNLFIGFVVGLMYSVSEEYFIYIFFLTIIYILNFKAKFLKPILGLIIGYAMMLTIIFLSNNFKGRSDKIVAYGIKSALYIYLAPNILSEQKKISLNEANENLKKEAINWAINKNINYEDNSYLLIKINNLDDNEKYLNYIFKKSLQIVFSNPTVTFKHIINSSLHTITLNPFYINYFYQHDGKGEFLKTNKHKKLIPVRIIYSIIVYLIILLGFLKFLKKKNRSLNVFLILSILYVILSLGWMGNPRYFTPALIFMSFFFGNFFNFSNDSLYKVNKFNT